MRDMAIWLVKSEPGVYSFANLVSDKKTSWDGVRNPEARNNLRKMKKGEEVLYYHTEDEKQVVGLAEVSKEAYADPTAEDGDWVSVELKPVRALKQPVTLVTVKANAKLAQMVLARKPRLSVQPVTEGELREVLKLGG